MIQTGNSTVYKGQDLELNRSVCIKIINLKNGHSSITKDYERALLEIKALISVSELTTHVPVIYEVFFDRDKALLYIIMQWINGKTLAQKLSDVSPVGFLDYIEKLCSILEKLEHQKLSHKDIKPSNIIITSDDDVFLIDFNLSISTPNQVEGTPYYKAPEMDINSPSLSRSKVDIFSIGIIMYEYFTGKIPVRGVDYAVQSRRRNTSNLEWEVFVNPKELVPELEPCIDEMITKCMKLDPKHRFRDSRELKRAIISAKRTIRNGSKCQRTTKKI